MSNNKRYYWFKLKEDFFTDKKINKLRKISGGDTYVIIYQKLLLLSLRDNGKLFYEGVESDFTKEMALTLDESVENVSITLNYLESQGLLEIIEVDKEFYLSEIENLVGSETASTIRSRKSREQKALQCNTNATLLQQNCNTEKEIEKEKEKDLEIDLEREGEKELDRVQNLHPTKSYGTFNNVVLTDEKYTLLRIQLGKQFDNMIDKLSMYMKSTGKEYKDHYATLLSWYQKDKEKEEKLSLGKREFTLADYEAEVDF